MRWDKAIGDAGFAILPALFSREYLDQLLQQIDESAPRRSHAGIRHALRLSPVAASPTANWLVVWHQDTALPLRERIDQPGWGPWSVKGGIDYAHAPSAALSQVLALRVSCDDSTLENGPLRVLPGTHTLGVLSDDTLHDLSTRIALVDCVAPKGGVVAMCPLVVHASSKSQTEMPRRVLRIEYAASESIVQPLKLVVA